jgi:hypothetical protein
LATPSPRRGRISPLFMALLVVAGLALGFALFVAVFALRT